MNIKSYAILISLLMVLNFSTKAQKSPQIVLFENPDFLSAPKGYSHVAKIDLGNAWMLIISGQVALDKEGNIIRSGIAMGTTDNTPHYFDIMSVLMMQFGATMANEEGYVTFDKSSAEDKNRVPAMEALDFYVKFAQDKWETYNWNETKNNALEEFAAGNIAYYLGYHQEMAQIKQLAPTLNFDVAPLPQINTVSQINYPSYWLESVSANSKNQHLAWAFVQYLTNETNAGKYLTTTKQPASRRALINEQLADYELATFAEQALTAKSWYHGTNPQEAINLFKLMIDNARLETFTLEEIIRDTAAKVQLTVNP